MSFSKSLKQKAIKVWEDGYNHPFVQELGAGTLEKEKFKFYLLQDYLYLLEYAKVFAMAMTKADDEKMLGNLSAITKATLVDEMKLHHLYMKEFGISDEEVKNVRASLFNRTYTANMLATSLKGDLAHTLATVFPCAWTYCDYGKRLKEQYKDTLENNFYKSWIDTYSGADFEESFEWFYDALDELVANKSEAEKKVVEDIFISSVEFEYMFWDMAYNKRLKEQYKDTLENNFYKSWIETYSGADFEDSFEWFYDALDKLVSNKTEAEKKIVEDIFISSVEFEYMFWDMAYNKQMSYLKS